MTLKNVLYLGLDPASVVSENDRVVHLPIIEIVPRPVDLPAIASVMADWEEYTDIIFTSRQAVVALERAMEFYSCAPRSCEVIAIGASTEKTLLEYGWKVSKVADDAVQEGVVAQLRMIDWKEDDYVLLPRSALARGAIEDFLLERMIRYQVCDLYDTVPSKNAELPDLEEFDEIFFTSPSTVAAFFSLIKEAPKRPKLTAIGPVTLQNLERMTIISNLQNLEKG